MIQFSNEKRIIKISDYIVFIILSINLLGIRTPYNNFIYTVLSFLWIIFVLLEKRLSSDLIKNKVIICFSVFILYSLITALCSSHYLDAIKINISLFYTYFSILLFYNLIYNKDFYLIKKIVSFSIFLIILTALCGIVVFSFNYDISSLIISHRIKYHLYPFGHLLGTYFSLSLLCAFASSYIFSKGNISSAIKLVIILFMVFSLFAIYKVRSSITLIVGVFGIIFCAICSSAKKHLNYKKPIYFVISILAFIIISVFLLSPEVFGNLLAKISSGGNSKLDSRLASVAEILKGNSASDAFKSAENRFSQIALDIKAFFNSPILGYNYLSAGNEDLLLNLGLGMHSQLADYLAQFGIIGFIPYFLFFLFHLLSIKWSCKNNISFSWIAILFILMIVNPFRDFISIFTVFFLIPSIYMLLGEINIENFYYYSRISK